MLSISDLFKFQQKDLKYSGFENGSSWSDINHVIFIDYIITNVLKRYLTLINQADVSYLKLLT